MQGSRATAHPRVGMLATVRNRRGLVASVEPFDSKEGRLHLVRIEYADADGTPEDTLLWEREHNATLLEPTALPRVGDDPPMPPMDFAALVRACRWSAVTPFLDAGGTDPNGALPIASPVFSAVQVEDFQLVPVLTALRMSRVSLLLADDVGLGKTIEAGLIVTELLIRRRVRRVLVLCPASLRQQWQEEMRTKFALTFDVVDRPETHALQKRLGLDANPWRTFPRIIASYHYFKQPDVLESFLTVCRPKGDAPVPTVLPWDLLIVDEAHNLMPSQSRVIQLQKMRYFASYLVGIPTDIYRFFAARRGTWLLQGQSSDLDVHVRSVRVTNPVAPILPGGSVDCRGPRFDELMANKFSEA